MAWVSPTTRAAGFLVEDTASWNQDVVDNPTYLYEKPAAVVFHNTTQSVGATSGSALAFNSETFDTDTMHDTVTNNSRITATTGGVYLLSGYAFTASGGIGQYYLELQIRNSGGGLIASIVNSFYNPTAATSVYMTIGGIYKLAATNYAQLLFYNGSSGSVTVAANPTFSAQWIGSGA